MSHNNSVNASYCMSRRKFLFAGGSIIALATLPGISFSLTATVQSFQRKFIANSDDLKQGQPIDFIYPDIEFANNFLVKLNEAAGGGIGPDNDIVAFNCYCPHMGGPLIGTYQHVHKSVGPCPFHLTTFDLTRHGMVISGHATESLPQIILELDGNNIFATGVMGLIYGHNSVELNEKS